MERKRLQRGRGTGRGLEDCGKASIGVQGSAESRGRDSIPLLGPEPFEGHCVRGHSVDYVWTECFYCCPIG